MDAGHSLNDLFPPIEPFDKGYLDAGGGHRIYWEQSGNPEGMPVVFIHGGPGAGAGPVHRRFFDPGHYRIIIFDQRGAGRSQPPAEISSNSTQHLIGDMEMLRQHLHVERWLMFGGSWGATLALVYGIAYPNRCLGFVLRGIFLGSVREIDWFLYGMGAVFPEAWDNFSGFLPESERDDLLEGYLKRLSSSDPAFHMLAAQSWNAYENSCSTLHIKTPDRLSGGSLNLARIEAHYFRHKMFLDDGYILANMDKIKSIPAVIVQGRYDMICPIRTADRLAAAWTDGWQEAQFIIVPDAGHSAMEPGIRSALVGATERFKTLK